MSYDSADPIICVCMQVTEDVIVTAIEAGAHNLPAIRAACGANTVCGSCTDDLHELLTDAAAPNDWS